MYMHMPKITGNVTFVFVPSLTTHPWMLNNLLGCTVKILFL